MQYDSPYWDFWGVVHNASWFVYCLKDPYARFLHQRVKVTLSVFLLRDTFLVYHRSEELPALLCLISIEGWLPSNMSLKGPFFLQMLLACRFFQGPDLSHIMLIWLRFFLCLFIVRPVVQYLFGSSYHTKVFFFFFFFWTTWWSWLLRPSLLTNKLLIQKKKKV